MHSDTAEKAFKVRRGPTGTHLFDRRTGLNILLDEQIPEQSRWSNAPRYMSIALTNACELECAYCYASKLAAKLPWESVLAWVQELDGDGAFGIGFGGGEPTLYPRFAELCRATTDSTSLAVSFTTHGHRFDNQLVSRLGGSVHFIRLSMDGVGPTYERLRGRPFDVFQQKLHLVRETSHFGVNFLVNSDTVDDLEKAADFAFENGAFEFLLLPELSPAGDARLEMAVLDQARAWVLENYSTLRLSAVSTNETDSGFLLAEGFGLIAVTKERR
jgi:MoaA/NifB/PqqE/SkfB family radical SAM enzyme